MFLKTTLSNHQEGKSTTTPLYYTPHTTTLYSLSIALPTCDINAPRYVTYTSAQRYSVVSSTPCGISRYTVQSAL